MDKSKLYTMRVRILLFFIGISLLSYGLGIIVIEESKISSFIETQGTVIVINVYSRFDDSIPWDDAVREPHFSSAKRSTYVNLPRYKPAYQYIVDGKKYAVCPEHTSYAYPPKGSHAAIKYNPNNPADAVVVDFPPPGSITYICMGILFLVAIKFVNFSNSIEQ